MIIDIKEPCKADWQKMIPRTDGRYCSQCDKVVKDFTQMNDAQVYDFVKQNRDTCGRFSQHQLNRPLLPQATFNYKWYGKAAAGTLLLSAFLPNNLKSQTVDSIAPPIASTLSVNTTVFSSSVLNGSVLQPDSAAKRIQQIKFSIDTFHLIIAINSQNSFSFQVPKQYVGDSIQVELSLADASTQSLKIGGVDQFVNPWHYLSSLCFVYNKERWSSVILSQPNINVLSLGGVSPYSEFEPIKIHWPTNLTLGYTVQLDSTNMTDTTEQPTLYKSIDYIKIQPSKSSSRSRSWLWYSLIGVLSLMLAIFGLKKLKKPLNTEINENEKKSESEQ